ncbi:MAG: hypothetical protein M3384_10155 [Acidobacteriota bacterium]|nr:hypothetical protein [Acidobacteriota bacterium]
MKKYFLLICLALFAFQVVAQPPPAAPDYSPENWKEYSYQQDNVKFRFPAEPKIALENSESSGVKFTIRKYIRQSFLAMELWVMEYPANIPEGKETLEFLRNVAVDSVKHMSPKIIKESDITVDGNAGKFIQMETSDGVVTRYKFFYVKNRIYYYFAAVRKGEKHGFNYENDFEKVAMGFLDSVKLIPSGGKK